MDFETWWANEEKNLCADTIWRKGDLLSLAKDAWNAALSAPAPAGEVDNLIKDFAALDITNLASPHVVMLVCRARGMVKCLSVPGPKEGA